MRFNLIYIIDLNAVKSEHIMHTLSMRCWALLVISGTIAAALYVNIRVLHYPHLLHTHMHFIEFWIFSPKKCQ